MDETHRCKRDVRNLFLLFFFFFFFFYEKSTALQYLSFRQWTSEPHFKTFWEIVLCHPTQLQASKFHYPKEIQNFLSRKEKSLMQANLKALRLFGHPWPYQNRPVMNSLFLTLGHNGLHSSKSKQKLNKVITCGRKHFGLRRTQILRKGFEVQNHARFTNPQFKLFLNSNSAINTAALFIPLNLKQPRLSYKD